ncbi:MAG: tetratricopeptide repeat protein, partial [Symploca sp. SIO2G7]|nr:tetratricopeptide repeat protein [Symploca sp. SIO2G7]
YRLLQQGIEQAQTSQFEAALQSWQQSLTIYREINDRKGEGDALNNLGLAYRNLGDYTQAIEYHQQSLAIAREINDRKGEGQSLGNLGIAYLNLGDYTQAIEYYQQSLAIAREINDRNGEGNSLGNLGNAYRNLGDYTQAIEYYQQSLAITREIKNRRGEANALGNLGIAYHVLGNYTQAIDYHQQSLAIKRKIKDRRGEGASLGNLGNAYHDLGNYTQAIDYHQQSLAIKRKIKDRRGEGTSLGNLGNAYNALGNYTQAIEYYQQSLAIKREIKDRRGEGQSLNNLGIAYDALGEYAQAIEYHQQSLAIAREINDRRGEGKSLGNLGTAYSNLGDYTQAIEYYQQSLAIAREIKDRFGEGQSLGNLGIGYSNLGNYSKAIEYHQQSLAIKREVNDRRGEGKSLGNLGNAYRKLGDYSQAIDYYQQSLAIKREIKDRRGEGDALGNLGNAYYSLGEYAQAIDYHQQSLAIKREIGDKDGEGVALNNLGLALFESGNLTEAETTLRTGIDVWESLREQLGENDAWKVSIFEGQAPIYRTLQQVLIAQNQPLPALEIAERGRARAFVELLARRIATTSDSANSPITPPTIEQLRQIAKQQNATLVEYSRITDEFKIKGKEEWKESELYIWVIKPTGEVTFRRSDLKPLWQQDNTSLAQLVTNTRQSMGVGDRSLYASFEPLPDQTERLKQLHQLLIEPIAQYLPTNPDERVIFLPQSSLFLVPFPALQDASGEYLIEKHTILTAPAIQVLELTREQKNKGAGGDMLIVGNPTMPSVVTKVGEDPQQLSNLPGAEQEAVAIAKLFNTQAITGNQATKSAILPKLSNAGIIHLATHGLLDDFRGLGIPGAIALAPDGTGKLNDGLLTAGEIFDLDLNAELVVLSACDTGRGRITGDGVIGLSRSLITAGVPSIIVSLWSVPDAPTADLMSEFYRNFQQTGNKAQALRQAMLTTMKTHPNPQDWAAFTLIGEAE